MGPEVAAEPAKIGIKEISEVLEGVKVLGVSGKKIFADGKVSVADLPEAMALVAKAQAIVDAVEGIDGVFPEVKDMDGAEAQAVLAKVFEVIAAIKGA